MTCKYIKITTICLLLTLLLALPVSASTQVITDGGFASGSTYWSTFTHIYDGDTDSANVIFYDNSVRYELFAAHKSYAAGQPIYGWVSQSVDLHGVSNITLSAKYQSGYLQYPTIQIYLGANLIGSFQVSSTSYQTYTINVPTNLQTTGTLYIYQIIYVDDTYDRTSIVYMDDVSAIAYTTPVTVSSITATPNPQNINTAVNFSIAFSGGDAVTAAGQSYIILDPGDGGNKWEIDLYGKTSPVYQTDSYSTTGTYTVSAYGSRVGTTTTAKTLSMSVIPAKPAGLLITVNPTIAEVNDVVTFQASASSGGSVNNWTWNYGDGSAEDTTSSSTTTHSYLVAGSYNVTTTANGPGGSTSYTLNNAVTVGNTFVTLDKTTYYIDEDTEIIANYSITPYDSGSSYSLQFWVLDSTYAPTSVINSIPISGSGDIVTGSKTFSITSINTNGNYGVFLFENDGYIAYDTTQVRYNRSSLTVNVLSGNGLVTAQTNVTLQFTNSTTLDTKSTTSGSVFFAPIDDGDYYVIVNATGYEQASKAVSVLGDTVVDIDMGGAVLSGYGAQYAPISCSWLVYNSYGSLLPNATVTCVGVQVSTSIDVLNKLFNFVLGETLVGDTQTMQTDSLGRVTFMVLPNTRYKISVTYGDDTQIQYYNVGPTSTAYTFAFKTSADATAAQNISSQVTASNGQIHVEYTDWLMTTTYITIDIYDDNNTIIDNWQAPSNAADQTFAITDYHNKEFTVVLNATTSQGYYEKNYPIYFVGPRIDLGIPPVILTWLAIFGTFAIGAVFTRTTVAIGSMATSLFMWLMFGLGWFWQIEEMITTPTLVLCLTFSSIVAILFMIVGDRL